MRQVVSSLFPAAFILLAGLSVSATTVRPPAVAGSFYPADSAALSRLVQSHLDQVKGLPEIDGDIVALIVPHAGLIYSGPIAAYSYKLLQTHPVHTVVLCGPSHRFGFEGISVYGPDVRWRTPLGLAPCNADLCGKMISSGPLIAEIPQAHAKEHCLEVQLPYLQTVLTDFTTVPVVMGYPRPDAIDALTDALKKLPLGDDVVLICATDWQHYKPAGEGWRYDSLGLECLKDLDANRLEKWLASDKVEACGGGTVVATIRAAVAKGANRAKILKYGDSGDATGDKSSVVGYAAAVLYRSAPGADTRSRAETQPAPAVESASVADLTPAEKQRLLTIARQAITGYLTNGAPPLFEETGRLAEAGAAFVTLTEQGQLRGCIGHTQAILPLYQTVAECAVSAAVSDPRFPPVTKDELGRLDIEISVLTPLQPVTSLDEIQVGRDGLMLSSGRARGLLLPQVATDYGWNRTEFLENTCRKAGLPSDAYKSPNAQIFKFQALIFGEQE